MSGFTHARSTSGGWPTHNYSARGGCPIHRSLIAMSGPSRGARPFPNSLVVYPSRLLPSTPNRAAQSGVRSTAATTTTRRRPPQAEVDWPLQRRDRIKAPLHQSPVEAEQGTTLPKKHATPNAAPPAGDDRLTPLALDDIDKIPPTSTRGRIGKRSPGRRIRPGPPSSVQIGVLPHLHPIHWKQSPGESPHQSEHTGARPRASPVTQLSGYFPPISVQTLHRRYELKSDSWNTLHK